MVDDYRLLSEIGSGAKGVVWLARRVGGGERSVVAVKFLKDCLVHDSRQASRFRRESQALSRVRHPNIVDVYGVGVFEEVPYIVMQYVGGVTLKDYIRRNGCVPVDEALGMAAQIADALDYCHCHGIIHRDVKSTNIRISESSNGSRKAVLLDFGIAKMEDLSLSITGTILGTPYYMSPEQAYGHKLDGRSDQYSLAVVLWEMLSGRLVFTAPSAVEVIHKHRCEKPGHPRIPGLSVLDPTYQRIDAALHRALAKNPSVRFRSCSEFVMNAAGRASTIAGDWRPLRAGDEAQRPKWLSQIANTAGKRSEPRPRVDGPGPSPISCLNVVSQLLMGLLAIVLVLSRLHM